MPAMTETPGMMMMMQGDTPCIQMSEAVSSAMCADESLMGCLSELGQNCMNNEQCIPISEMPTMFQTWNEQGSCPSEFTECYEMMAQACEAFSG